MSEINEVEPSSGWLSGPLMSRDQTLRRTSQACVPCGRRKTKCNGAIPACWQCHINSRECSYGYSKRNKRQKCNELLYSADHCLEQLQQSRLNVGLHQSFAPLSQKQAKGSVAPSQTSSNLVHEDHDQLLTNPISPKGLMYCASVSDVTISLAVSRRLFSAYFSYIHPVWPIIYKPLYDCDYESLAKQLSLPVVYAIYAIAASLNLDAGVSLADKTPLPSFFFEAALHSIQVSTDGQATTRSSVCHSLLLLQPSVEKCQALTLLALQQHGCAEVSSTSMLLSLAIGMALELGLHRVNSMNEDSISIQVKSRIWWNLFALEKMIAVELSRPMCLNSEATNTPLPSASETDEYQLLQFCMPNATSTISTKSYTISGFHTTVKLAKIMEIVARKIYSTENRETIRNNPQTGEQARLSLWYELKEYYALITKSSTGVEVNILVDKAIPPYLLRNVLWYWAITIIIHRPFWSRRQGPALNSYGFGPVESDPFEVSFAAAETICQILEAHAENLHKFPCDLVFPILTAANTFSCYRKADWSQVNDEMIAGRLAMCLSWLSILGRNWHHAVKSREQLSEDLALVEPSLGAPSLRLAEGHTPTSKIVYAVSPITSGRPEYNSSSSVGLPRENTLRFDNDSSRNNFALLDMLGDAEDDLRTTNPDLRDFIEQWSGGDFG